MPAAPRRRTATTAGSTKRPVGRLAHSVVPRAIRAGFAFRSPRGWLCREARAAAVTEGAAMPSSALPLPGCLSLGLGDGVAFLSAPSLAGLSFAGPFVVGPSLAGPVALAGLVSLAGLGSSAVPASGVAFPGAELAVEAAGFWGTASLDGSPALGVGSRSVAPTSDVEPPGVAVGSRVAPAVSPGLGAGLRSGAAPELPSGPPRCGAAGRCEDFFCPSTTRTTVPGRRSAKRHGSRSMTVVHSHATALQRISGQAPTLGGCRDTTSGAAPAATPSRSTVPWRSQLPRQPVPTATPTR